MDKRWMGVVATLTLAAAGGCEWAGFVEPDPGEPIFFATVDGGLPWQYEGSGTFVAGADPRRPAAPAMFRLQSRGVGASAGAQFSFWAPGAQLPASGSHRLGLGDGAVQARLSRPDPGGATKRTYAAAEGELLLTRVSPDRIEGTFHLEGFRICEHPSPALVACTVPAGVPEEAPRVVASGHFVAKRN